MRALLYVCTVCTVYSSAQISECEDESLQEAVMSDLSSGSESNELDDRNNKRDVVEVYTPQNNATLDEEEEEEEEETFTKLEGDPVDDDKDLEGGNSCNDDTKEEEFTEVVSKDYEEEDDHNSNEGADDAEVGVEGIAEVEESSERIIYRKDNSGFKYEVVQWRKGGVRLLFSNRSVSGKRHPAGIYSTREEAEAVGEKILASEDIMAAVLNHRILNFAARSKSYYKKRRQNTYFAKLFALQNHSFMLFIGQPNGALFRGWKAGTYDSPFEALAAALNIFSSANPLEDLNELQRLVHVKGANYVKKTSQELAR